MKYLVGNTEHKLGLLSDLEAVIKDMPISENMDSILILIYEKAYNEFYKDLII